MPKIFSPSKMFLTFFFAHENMKKPSSKVAHNQPQFFFQYCQPAQNQPKSHFLFHKNASRCDFYIMTLSTDIKDWALKSCSSWHPYEMLFPKFNSCRTDLHKSGASIATYLTLGTSHSAYAATETELYAAKIDGLLPPNFL